MITEIGSRFLRWVALLSMLSALHVSPSAAASDERRYVVKVRDTLTEIARRHGVTVSALIAHNRLTQPNKIAAGKVLRIPDPKAGIDRPALDSDLRKKLDRVRVSPRKWKHIVIHHRRPTGTVAGMDDIIANSAIWRMARLSFRQGTGTAWPTEKSPLQALSDQLDGTSGELSLNARSIGVSGRNLTKIYRRKNKCRVCKPSEPTVAAA